MTHFRKCWTSEMREWIKANATLDRKADYLAFCDKFGVTDITFTAFYNQRSLIGACKRSRPPFSTRHKPLGSEHEKKGYVRVKIAEPNVWRFKHWVAYEKAHPDEPALVATKDQVLFLDGNRRNFDPANLYRIDRSVMGILNNQFGGVAAGNADETLTRIKMAEMKRALFKRAKKLGLLGAAGSFKEDVNRRAREYQARPEVYARNKEKRKREYERMKREEPEKYEARRAAHRAYMREYYKRHKT